MNTNTKLCARCDKKKELTDFDEGKATCKACLLVKQKYRLIEIDCPICNCKVKRNALTQHLKTQKHINNQKGKETWDLNTLKAKKDDDNTVKCSHCKKREPLEGLASCEKCHGYQKKQNEKQREKRANNGNIYCEACEQKVKPENWEIHFTWGRHIGGLRRQIMNTYVKGLKEATTQEEKDKIIDEKNRKLQEWEDKYNS